MPYVPYSSDLVKYCSVCGTCESLVDLMPTYATRAELGLTHGSRDSRELMEATSLPLCQDCVTHLEVFSCETCSDRRMVDDVACPDCAGENGELPF
jgi:hypothetical protein